MFCVPGGEDYGRCFLIDRSLILTELANFSALKKKLPAKEMHSICACKMTFSNFADVGAFLYSTMAYIECFQISKMERFVKIDNS